MPQHSLNEKLIKAIKEFLPEGETLLQKTMDILSIGRESAYRRLRGDVSFTFEEVVKISDEFNLSIDQIVDIHNNRAFFNLNFLGQQKGFDNYISKLENHIAQLKKMHKAKYNIASYVSNSLPYSFYLFYDNLSKFMYYKWLYQINMGNDILSYMDLEIPANVITLQKKFISESNRVQQSLFIIDRSIFYAIVNDIEYFFKLHLINIDDFKLLQSELLCALNDIEHLASSGINNAGNDVSIYLSNVDLEATFVHFEYDEKQSSHFILYSMDGINTQLPSVCQKQKEWIRSLKRYSTLITQSGEIQRVDYFKKQRELINNMYNSAVGTSKSR